MTDMPERIWIDHDNAGSKDRAKDLSNPPLSSFSGIFTEYRRADAPVNAALAMQCPEVQALVQAARVLEAVFSAEITRTGGNPFSGTWSIPTMGVRTTCDGAISDVDAALAPFTEETGIAPRNGPKPGY